MLTRLAQPGVLVALHRPITDSLKRLLSTLFLSGWHCLACFQMLIDISAVRQSCQVTPTPKPQTKALHRQQTDTTVPNSLTLALFLVCESERYSVPIRGCATTQRNTRTGGDNHCVSSDLLLGGPHAERSLRKIDLCHSLGVDTRPKLFALRPTHATIKKESRGSSRL